MRYNEEDERVVKRMKHTNWKRILFAVLCLCTVFLLHVTEAKANDQEQEQQEIEYKIVKVKS